MFLAKNGFGNQFIVFGLYNMFKWIFHFGSFFRFKWYHPFCVISSDLQMAYEYSWTESNTYTMVESNTRLFLLWSAFRISNDVLQYFLTLYILYIYILTFKIFLKHPFFTAANWNYFVFMKTTTNVDTGTFERFINSGNLNWHFRCDMKHQNSVDILRTTHI